MNSDDDKLFLDGVSYELNTYLQAERKEEVVAYDCKKCENGGLICSQWRLKKTALLWDKAMSRFPSLSVNILRSNYIL